MFTSQTNKSCNIGNFNPEQQIQFNYLLKNLTVSSWSKCGTPCTTMGITLGYPIYDISKHQEAYLKFYFKSTINVRRSLVAYSGTSLMAEVGGYIGLLLGFSLLDLTKLVKNIFTLTKVTLIKKSKNNNSTSIINIEENSEIYRI